MQILLVHLFHIFQRNIPRDMNHLAFVVTEEKRKTRRTYGSGHPVVIKNILRQESKMAIFYLDTDRLTD